MSSRRGSGARRSGNPARRRPLTGDLARLAQPNGNTDPRRLGGKMSGPGGPHDRGAVVLDLTDAVLLDHTEVCVMDTVRRGVLDGEAILLTMHGRVNNTPDRVQVGYVLGADGAAALITQLLALADRAGPEMLDDLTRRLTALHQDRHVDLAWLRAAVDNAIELAADTAIQLAADTTPQATR